MKEKTENYVLGFAFNETETALALLLKARPDWQRGHLNGVGGRIEGNETPLAAMNREWDEETDCGEVQWRFFAALQGQGFGVYCFRASSADLTGVASLSEGEDLVLVDPDSLPSTCLPNLSWLVPMARMKNRNDWPFSVTERNVSLVGDDPEEVLS